MRFAKERRIPAQGRGSAADSIVAYVLGITRVDPIRHNLLFERFINEGRTTYPDVDIDFSSERREEVIQYVYERYGTEHTGMVCNLVTYRARSAVREVGYALGFPSARRPGGQGARDLRLGDGQARPRGGRRLRRVLPPPRRAARRRRLRRPGRRPWPRGPDGPARPRARPPAGPRGRRAPDRDPAGDGLEPAIRAAGPPTTRAARGTPRRAWPARPGRPAAATAASPASVAGPIREGIPAFGPGAGPPRAPGGPPGTIDGRLIDPESGVLAPPARSVDRLGRPRHFDPPSGPAGGRASSVARIVPEPPPAPRGGSTVGMSPWERWLELCARIDGFPRHLSIHTGGMLVTAAPLVDIARWSERRCPAGPSSSSTSATSRPSS